MGLRGELQYYNAYITDYWNIPLEGDIYGQLTDSILLDASTVFFDSRTAGAVTTKAGSMFEVGQGEIIMNRRVAGDKLTFNIVAVGLDAKASVALEAKVKALGGVQKNIYFGNPDTGVMIAARNVPITVQKKWESNAKTEYTITAEYETEIYNATMDLS